jgi:hypothetical protein
MRNLLAFSSASYRCKRLLQRPVEAIDDFGSFPEKALQALYPLEIRNHDASYITENVGNDENLVPALKQDLVGFCGSWSIRRLCENPALQGSRPRTAINSTCLRARLNAGVSKGSIGLWRES